MSDLVAFLLARIAEDEAAAAPRRSEVNHPAALDLGSHGWVKASIVPPLERWESEGGAWGRGRVLAECEAKRRAVAEWESADATAGGYPGTDAGYEQGLYRALELLAHPYADHEDFQEAWRL